MPVMVRLSRKALTIGVVLLRSRRESEKRQPPGR
jgi:hypothetical protein